MSATATAAHGASEDAGVRYARSTWVVGLDYLYSAWLVSEIVSVLFNKRRRALHDFLAGTVVVVERQRRAAGVPA